MRMLARQTPCNIYNIILCTKYIHNTFAQWYNIWWATSYSRFLVCCASFASSRCSSAPVRQFPCQRHRRWRFSPLPCRESSVLSRVRPPPRPIVRSGRIALWWCPCRRGCLRRFSTAVDASALAATSAESSICRCSAPPPWLSPGRRRWYSRAWPPTRASRWTDSRGCSAGECFHMSLAF